MNTIEELIASARGDWKPENRSVVEQANGFHLCISRAWVEYTRWGAETWRMKDYGPGRAIIKIEGLPENGEESRGLWPAIADLCIHLADTMGAYGIATRSVPRNVERTIPELIAKLHQYTQSLVTCDVRWAGTVTFSRTLTECLSAAEHSGVDLWAIIREKLAYNATREHRHGGLKA